MRISDWSSDVCSSDLSELDVLYRSDFGLHVSGTGWYDHSCDDHEHTNPNPPLSQIPSYEGGEYSHYTKRYYRVPSDELLDALIFTNFHLGSVPVSVISQEPRFGNECVVTSSCRWSRSTETIYINKSTVLM